MIARQNEGRRLNSRELSQNSEIEEDSKFNKFVFERISLSLQMSAEYVNPKNLSLIIFRQNSSPIFHLFLRFNGPLSVSKPKLDD